MKTTATLLAVLALAACGGSKSPSQAGDGPTTTVAQPLSKAAYSVELQRVGTSLVSALNTFGKKFTNFKTVEKGVTRGQAALTQAARTNRLQRFMVVISRKRHEPSSSTEEEVDTSRAAGGAFMEPRGCNGWQSAANRPALEIAQTSEIRCNRLPRLRATFHGKEGV